MKTIALVLTLILLIKVNYGQNTIALPEIINYSKQNYHAGTQNWDVEQDENGIMYFANNEGLLSFDGTYWKLYPLPNKTIVRSIAIGKDNNIYVGSQEEIGYFAPNKNGKLTYYSLKGLIPEQEREFADVWNVITYDNHIFFRSNRKIFQYSNGKITAYSSINWGFLGLSNGLLIAQEYDKGLLVFQNGLWVPIKSNFDFTRDVRATSLTPIAKDSSLLTTLKDGVFIITQQSVSRFETGNIRSIAARNIYASCMINEDHIALATNLGGCYIINKKGEFIQRLSKQDGLQNNNVLCVFPDKDKNLWIALDNGIDFVAYNSAIKHIFPDNQEKSAGYTTIIYKNQLYVGTSRGLYQVPIYETKDLSFVKGSFELVANTKGQVWNLSEVNNHLLMGHNEGAFVIKDKKAVSLDNTSGFWTFQPFDHIQPSSIMVAGTYNGINFYDYKDGRFRNTDMHAHFESARFVSIDNKTIWAAHPYKGLYKVQFDTANRPLTTHYKDNKGTLSVNHNYVYKVKSRIIVSTDNGLFEYNALKDEFEPSTYFKDIFGTAKVQYLKEDQQGNIWFIQEKRLGVVEIDGSKHKIIYLPELTNKLMTNGYEQIYPFNKNNIFAAGEEGFFVIDFEKYKLGKQDIPVLIRTVKTFNKADSLIFGGYDTTVDNALGESPRIDHRWNSLQFEFSSPLYGQALNIEYSYYLKGFDKGWSHWSKKAEKNYTNLPAGAYTFQVKARNNLGNESSTCSFSFIILPPWYQTFWAYCFYTCFLFAAAYGLHRWQKKKFLLQQQKYEDEQRRLQYLHQLEMEKSEKEIVKLKNEKLEAELAHKNTELASSAMHLVQKGELISKMKEELSRTMKKIDDTNSITDFKKMLKVLSEDDKVDKDWEHFARHFDSMHSDFLVALKGRHPNLSPNEVKLCIYLRMNLSSKEIAQLMNISVRGIEISRYRLRKKLQIPTETNLFDYLMEFHGEKRERPEE